MRMTDRRRMLAGRAGRGQALAEFVMVIPVFALVVFSVIVFGLYVFYNQQLANAAREAARYAAIHSSTAQCPTVSWLEPISTIKPPSYYRCDAPQAGWPRMTAAARANVWGVAPSAVRITACWSGFVDPTGNHDALPEPPNTFVDCRIGGIDPNKDQATLPCPAGTTSTDDKASDTAFANGIHYQTTVTVYACFQWSPPMAGFILIPSQVTMRAVVTEVLQRQQ